MRVIPMGIALNTSTSSGSLIPGLEASSLSYVTGNGGTVTLNVQIPMPAKAEQGGTSESIVKIYRECPEVVSLAVKLSSGEQLSGNVMSWGEFPPLLPEGYRREKVKRGVSRLREILTDEDIKKIEESHRKMHERFKI
ncbi:MAG: hypothetical protein RXQ74_02320 [Caldivirga sp.]